MIQILIEFINSAPIISFNKMTKTKSIQKLIAENFKHSDIEIRNIISELAFAFFCLLKNRDNDIRKNYFQIIYDLIIGILGHITKDTDIFAIHGSILLIKSISLIKDLFHAQSKHILLILFKFKDCSYLPIKNSIIEFIPDLTDYIRDNENIFEKFFDFLIDEYIRDINEYTNSLIDLDKKQGYIDKETLKTIAILIAPFAPHVGEEFYHMLGGNGTVFDAGWPKFDPALAKADTIKLPIQNYNLVGL